MTISAKINPQDRIIVNKMDYGDKGLRNLTGSSILELQDVSNTAPTDQQYLRYNANTGQWESQSLDLSNYLESANLSAATDQAIVRYSVVGNTVQLDTSGVIIDDSGNLSIPGSLYPTGALYLNTDTVLQREASDTLALRRGTNSQEFRLYNTYTDASNYERGHMKWDSNVFEIGAISAGTGSNRVVRIRSRSGVLELNDGNSTFRLTSSGFSSDNEKQLGYTSKGWAGIYFAEQSADLADPAEGHSVIWQSDGTGSGDDGDIMMKITAGGVTKTATLIDFSAV